MVDDCVIAEYPEFNLFVMAYFPENGSFTERLQNVIQNDLSNTKQNILYIHEGINGALAQSSDKELPAKLFEPFDKVLVGHYHNRTKIKGTAIDTSVQAASITSEKTKKKVIFFFMKTVHMNL